MTLPKPPLPAHLDELLRHPNPAVIGTLKPDGSPHTVASWYLWDEGVVLVTMDHARKRLDYMRNDSRVSLTVLDAKDWYSHVSLRGRVIELRPDEGLADADRISHHYAGVPYPDRDRPRVTAVIEVLIWHAWEPWHTFQPKGLTE